MTSSDKNEAETVSPSKSSSSSSRPTISLPPRTFNESFFTGGSTSGLGFSPGPMTLVSSFFSDSDNVKSFSQLLAAFPTAEPLPESPGFALPSPQGAFGMTHQQALAQITGQTGQVNSNANIQPQRSSSLASAPEISFSTNSTMQKQMPPPSVPEPGAAMKEPLDYSNSDQRSQASSIVFDKPSDDGYNWRKYGQKQVKGSEFPRSYYKCTHANCPVKKKVERSPDGQVTEIIYKGQHNHQPPQSNKRAKDSGNSNGNPNYQGSFESGSQFQSGYVHKLKEKKDQESSQATGEHLSGTSDSEEVGDTETGADEIDGDEPDPKRRNTEIRVTEPTSSHRTVTEPRIIVQTTSEVDLLDDGYRWRKYGQKVVKGNLNPRSYYKCTTQGCKVRKHVERAASDPRAVITTYGGKHNHDVPTAKGSNHGTANNNVSQFRTQNDENHASVNARDFGNNDQQPVARLRLKQEQIT